MNIASTKYAHSQPRFSAMIEEYAYPVAVPTGMAVKKMDSHMPRSSGGAVF
jgi:hypothetical protein